MIFDSYDCADAEGVLLAHTLRIPGGTFKKGRVLSREDLAALREAGIARVSGVRLEAGDVDEDQAALEVARALAGPLVDVGRPVAGRCYLYARRDGLAVVQREVIDAINQCDTGMVIATLSDCAECLQQQAVASVKVIPFAVARAQLERCVALAAAAGGAVALRAFQPRARAAGSPGPQSVHRRPPLRRGDRAPVNSASAPDASRAGKPDPLGGSLPIARPTALLALVRIVVLPGSQRRSTPTQLRRPVPLADASLRSPTPPFDDRRRVP